MPSTPAYKIVKLAHGGHSVQSLAHQETFHPVIGPVAEAEALYVRQLRLLEYLSRPLQVDGVIFFYGEIESCVRLD